MAELSEARFKLGEAAYFLDRMRETHNSEPEFRYNLSAFLSACLSSFEEWILKRPFQAAGGDMRWLRNHLTTLKARREVAYLVHARHANVHRKPVTPLPTVISTTDTTESYIPPDPYVGAASFSHPDIPPPSIITHEYSWMFDAAHDRYGTFLPPAEDVLTFCSQRLADLQAFVADCEAHTSQPPASPSQRGPA